MDFHYVEQTISITTFERDRLLRIEGKGAVPYANLLPSIRSQLHDNLKLMSLSVHCLLFVRIQHGDGRRRLLSLDHYPVIGTERVHAPF